MNDMVNKSKFHQEIGKVTELAQYLELELGSILILSEATSKELNKSNIDNSKAYEKLIDMVSHLQIHKKAHNLVHFS